MPVISPKKPYRIGRSRTGLGLFATKPIKKGAKIVRYFGPLLDSRKKKDDAVENKYLFELNGRWTIDGSVRENIARYINHACRPNAESDVMPRKRKVVVENVNVIKRHTKQNSRTGRQGGIIEREAPIDVSNVMLLDPQGGQPTRVGRQVLGDGTRTRIAKRSGAVVE